jgi:hypothetical protein
MDDGVAPASLLLAPVVDDGGVCSGLPRWRSRENLQINAAVTPVCLVSSAVSPEHHLRMDGGRELR